ncbi:MAG: hypothetical protein GF330_00625 [Candidatus Eisenbacteria bacterium]|nr:hypothetical protein [Candidatus Eisenbacteria bacterium]
MPSAELPLTLWERFSQFAFYQHALAAGLAIAVGCAVLSVFVVHRRMAFIGQGVTHAAFGGVGAALFLELWLPALRHPLLREAIVAFFCVATAILIGRIGRQRRIGEDSAIGIVLVVAMAVGVILIDLRTEWVRRMAAGGELRAVWQGYAPSFHDILFGSILSVTRTEVWVAVGVTAAVLLWVAVFFRGLLFYAVDEEGATAFGLPTVHLHYGLLVALGLMIVVAMRLLGVILISALLILPGITAGLWSRRIVRVIVASMAFAAASLIVGLLASMQIQVLSTGPVIVVVLALFFLVSWITRGRR